MIYSSGSGWASRPTTLQPAISGDVSCEVVVIGGGLGGMAAALKLAEIGMDVVLLEADVCGWGASARNGGYVTPTLGSTPRILNRFYRDRLPDLVRFANTAVTFIDDLIASQQINCDYEQTGYVETSTTAKGYARLRASAKSGRRSVIGSAQEIGIPSTFYGGTHIKVGGTLNPAKLSLGLRNVVLASAVRVFEHSPVQRLTDSGGSVSVDLPVGTVRADRAILMANGFSNGLNLAPRSLAKPVWITAVETEPISPERIDDAGWTSRLPMLTTHNIMQSFRLTPRETIVHICRKLEVGRRARHDKMPNQVVVDDLIRGFRERLPSLADVASECAWGGWIAETPSNMAVAGSATENVLYSLACNGHGLTQAPYVGSMLGEYLGGQEMPTDLRAIWRDSPRFMPGVVNPLTLRLGWLDDRAKDFLDRRS